VFLELIYLEIIMTEILTIELTRLDDQSTQTRAELRKEAIADYAEKVREGKELDPALVYDDGTRLYLAAGFHRREAYRQAGRDRMPCVVLPGTRRDAIQAGIADKLKHLGENMYFAGDTRAVRRGRGCEGMRQFGRNN
jgi:ParB-like chromosome segregation protein Spo0J